MTAAPGASFEGSTAGAEQPLPLPAQPVPVSSNQACMFLRDLAWPQLRPCCLVAHALRAIRVGLARSAIFAPSVCMHSEEAALLSASHSVAQRLQSLNAKRAPNRTRSHSHQNLTSYEGPVSMLDTGATARLQGRLTNLQFAHDANCSGLVYWAEPRPHHPQYSLTRANSSNSSSGSSLLS